MIRNVEGLKYDLTFKKVKRLNLRVRSDGSAAVSAPRRIALAQIDQFVLQHANWVAKARERLKNREDFAQIQMDDAQCFALFSQVLERLYPLVEKKAPQKPSLKMRQMKSRWGVCHPAKNYITLNKQLAGKPLAALEYVVLHELVHLLHPNHQAGFHAEMARLMPDYKARRALLK